MKIRVIGGGWYGAHTTLALLAAGHQVELHEQAGQLFAGASGANPARLHKGFHYPRSRLTRAACLDHADAFMTAYGDLTRTIPCNVYAVADESLVDFGSYCDVLAGTPFITLDRPHDLGLRNIEGAVLTGERHIVIDQARAWFTQRLGDAVKLNRAATDLDDPEWDVTVDCSFCAFDAEAVDRYEPCVVGLLAGPVERAVTIMDGPFPSVYPWSPGHNLSSISSASLTPLSKACRTYGEAHALLSATAGRELSDRVHAMLAQMAHFWPEVQQRYQLSGWRTAIRAMPKSGADARLVDVIRVGKRGLRVRAGKIDAIFRAEHLIKDAIACWPSPVSAVA